MLINKVNSVGTTIRNFPPPIFQPQTHLTIYEFSFHSTLLLILTAKLLFCTGKCPCDILEVGKYLLWRWLE